jgi:autotransporter-associated beta strand protein
LGSSAANLNISGSNVTLSNNINLTGSAIISNADAVTLSGVISGNGTLTKSGIGTLTLSGSNTNAGTTTVSAGTLVVDGSTSSATTVASGATLAGRGSLGGSVTVQNGGTLSPGGAGVGTLTVNGNLTLNSGSTLALNINGVTAGTGYDRVVVNGTVDISAATLAVSHGYAPASGDSYTLIVNDAADAVTGTFSGISEGGKFNAAGNSTELTTSYIGGTGNDLTLTTPIAPTITNVSSSTANGTYKIGDVITINVQFDATVNVTGTPTLTLETGATDRVLSYVSGSGTNTLSFSYTVQAGDISADLDYVSTSALSLNGGSIQDGANQSAVLTLAAPGAAGSLGANKALVVDGVRPAATNITLSDTALRIGETATVTITFNERVSGLDTGDFTVANGSLSNLSSSDGGLTWTATFTPSANISNATNLITLNNTGVMDLAGNIGSGTTDSVNYAIDTQRPTASIMVTDIELKAGQSTTVTITFSEAVVGLTAADFTVANAALSNLTTSDNITWTATLTPGANVTDATNLITLDNFGYTDTVGNPGDAPINSNNYAIDTQRPMTLSVLVADTTLKAGQSTTVTITFSEAVTGLDVSDFTVVDGVLSGLSTADGGLTWTATLTPVTGKVHSGLQVALNNAGYTDLAGNAGTNISFSASYAINTVLPAQPVLQVQSNAEGSATVRVDALEAGAPWEYSLDGGQSWQAGQGNLVAISSPGLYDVQARQTNAAGNVSQAGVLSVDVAPQAVPPRVEWPVMGIFSGSSAGAGSGIWDAAVAPAGLTPLGFDADATVLPRGSGNVFLGSGYATPAGSSFFGGGVATDVSELSSGFLGGYSGVIGASAFAGVAPQEATADQLVLLQLVDAVVAAADRQVDWKIPPTMFGHSDPLASVQFSMTLANGQPLPAWLKFDARTGQVSGVMPAGFQGELTLRLTARDSQGHTVSTVIKLKAADAGTVARAGVGEQLLRHAQFRAGHMAAQRLHL